jgi:PST family polysaccharide transporter
MATGIAWTVATRWLGVATSVLATAVLARLLVPADFAVVAAAAAVAGFVGLVQESGLGAAVVHQREDDARVATTAFVLHLAAATIGLAVSLALAPSVARFFGVTQVGALAAAFVPVWLAAWATVPTARLQKRLAFHRLACVQALPALVHPAVAIPAAATGLGAWALVLGQIAGAAASAAAAWAFAGWRPRRCEFSVSVARTLASYGRPLLGANLLGRLNDSVDTWVAGRLWGPAALGAYAMGFRLATLPRFAISFAVSGVLFPALAMVRDDRARLQQGFLRSVHWVGTLAVPAAVVLGMLASDVIGVVLGPRWDGAVGPTRVLAVFAALAALSATTGDVFKATGRPGLVWRIGVVHSAVLWTGLAVLAPRGLVGVALAVTGATAVSSSIALGVALRMLGLGIGALARALAGPVLGGAVMGAVLAAVEPAAGGVIGLASAIAAGGAAFVAVWLATAPVGRQDVAVLLGVARERWGRARLAARAS